MEDCMDTLELSRIHQAVLGLQHCDLKEELSGSRIHEIDALDSRDRSALSWAALKGDYDAVSLLIAAGADIDLADCEGNLSAWLIYWKPVQMLWPGIMGAVTRFGSL